MLYYLENPKLTECMICGHYRYKPRIGMGKTLMTYKKLRCFPITPRLQRLFISPRTAEHMIWHQSHDVIDGVMVHPSNGKAWKHFNSVHSQFSVESRNVHFGRVQTNSTYSGYLLLLILVGRSYSRFTTFHQGCVWGRSLFFYIRWYPIRTVRAEI
jgi:hypothetical protein